MKNRSVIVILEPKSKVFVRYGIWYKDIMLKSGMFKCFNLKYLIILSFESAYTNQKSCWNFLVVLLVTFIFDVLVSFLVFQ